MAITPTHTTEVEAVEWDPQVAHPAVMNYEVAKAAGLLPNVLQSMRQNSRRGSLAGVGSPNKYSGLGYIKDTDSVVTVAEGDFIAEGPEGVFNVVEAAEFGDNFTVIP